MSLFLFFCLAVSGIRKGDFTAKHFSVEWRKAVGCLRVKQPEKLQLVNVEIADGLHLRKLGDHLKYKEMYKRMELVHEKSYAIKTQT